MNNTLNPERRVWDVDSGITTRGINAFRAAEAVRRQDTNLFSTFHGLLLDAYHIKHFNISNVDILRSIVEESGADINRFLIDYNSSTILDKLIKDHFHAVDNLKIFGTPTFVFNGTNSIFLKIDSPDLGENLDFFRELMNIAENRTHVLEIKRP